MPNVQAFYSKFCFLRPFKYKFLDLQNTRVFNDIHRAIGINFKIPQKLTSTACFIQGESSDGIFMSTIT